MSTIFELNKKGLVKLVKTFQCKRLERTLAGLKIDVISWYCIISVNRLSTLWFTNLGVCESLTLGYVNHSYTDTGDEIIH